MENPMNKYVEMVQLGRKLVKDGLNDLDPIVRSVFRKASTFWKKMTIEDKGLADLALFLDENDPYDLVYDTGR